MDLVIVISDDVHRAALRQARSVGQDVSLPAGRLNAPLDNEANRWISEIWDVVEGAIQKAYREGMEAARPLIDRASEMFSGLAGTAAKQAQDIRTVIAERLNTYMTGAIDGALGRVRPSLSVGGRALKLQRVTVEQRINMSGSLKASLSEICAFVAEGELSLSAEYGSLE